MWGCGRGRQCDYEETGWRYLKSMEGGKWGGPISKDLLDILLTDACGIVVIVYVCGF